MTTRLKRLGHEGEEILVHVNPSGERQIPPAAAPDVPLIETVLKVAYTTPSVVTETSVYRGLSDENPPRTVTHVEPPSVDLLIPPTVAA